MITTTLLKKRKTLKLNLIYTHIIRFPSSTTTTTTTTSEPLHHHVDTPRPSASRFDPLSDSATSSPDDTRVIPSVSPVDIASSSHTKNMAILDKQEEQLQAMMDQLNAKPKFTVPTRDIPSPIVSPIPAPVSTPVSSSASTPSSASVSLSEPLSPTVSPLPASEIPASKTDQPRSQEDFDYIYGAAVSKQKDNSDSNSNSSASEHLAKVRDIPSIHKDPIVLETDDIDKEMFKIDLATKIIGHKLTTSLEQRGVLLEETSQATERQEALHNRVKEYVKSLDLSRFAKRSALVLAATYTAYYLLRYRQIPLGGFIQGLLGSGGAASSVSASPTSSVVNNINFPGYMPSGIPLNIPNIIPNELKSVTSGAMLNLSMGTAVTVMSGLVFVYKFLQLMKK